MGIVPAGTGAGGGAAADRQRAVPARGVRPRRSRDARGRSIDYYGGAPRNAGLVFKVVPDETMRGLELRNGSVDLVVNDLSPDLVHGLEREGRLRVVTGAGHRLRVHRLQSARPAAAGPPRAPGHRLRHRHRRHHQHLRRGLARPATGIVPSMSWAYDRDAIPFTHDLARARALLDEAGYPDPDGDGPAPRLRLTLKTSTAEPYRVQAAVIQQQLAEAGIALEVRSYEFATLMADVMRGNVQLYTLQYVGVTDPDMLRRAFHSTQMPPDGFNRGHYANPEVDRLITRPAPPLDDAERGGSIARSSASSPPMRRTSVCGRRSTWRSRSRRSSGITLSPTADFAFLKDVVKSTGGTERYGRAPALAVPGVTWRTSRP